MTITQAIGIFLLALVFAVIFGFMLRDLGWKAAVTVVVFAIAVSAVVLVGAVLAAGWPGTPL